MLQRFTIHLFFLFCFIALFLPAPTMAGETGKIAGRVTDAANGQPLIGANVMIIERWENDRAIPLSSSGMQGAVTDPNGEYFIINVKPGIYSVKFVYIGYQTVNKTQIRVSVDLTSRIDCKLSSTVLESGVSIDVVADRVQIQKDLTSSQVSFGADKIDILPVRSVSELVNLQAGVVTDNSGNLHIRGGRTSEITYMVDGVKVVDPLSRSAGISIDDQAIQELKTITGTFNAEYGQALSGVINIVTKQGSDQFRINATGYLGDHLSFDDKTYSVMSNADWANAAARAMTRKSRYLIYDFGDVNPYSATAQAEKPWLTHESYLDSYDPTTNSDFQVNVSGPIPLTSKKMTYFVSGRYQDSPNYAYGKRYFMPWGFQSPVGDTVTTFARPDNALVPLGWYKGYSTQSKLFYDVSSKLKLSYGLYYNFDRSYGVGYDHKYVPDAGKYYNTRSQTHIFSAKYIASVRTFIDFKANYYKKHHKNFLYEDPYDPRYMPTETAMIEQYEYGRNGDDDISVISRVNDFTYYGNSTDIGKNDVSYQNYSLDVTSQVGKRHLVKLGATTTLNDLRNDWFQMQFSDVTFRPLIPDESSPYHVKYSAKPKELAAYIQDKIEFNELIINIGLRYDYFDPDGRVLADPADPQIYAPFKFSHIYKNYTPTTPDSALVEYSVAERNAFWWKKARIKSQLSPRFGLSFPITDQGVIHFSYGWFFQNPQMSFLYNNPNFWIEGAGASNLVGNADIDAERTVMYEIGLQQQLTNELYMHLTGFYRDIRDWIGTGEPIDTYKGMTYYKYVNKDHAAAKGVTLTAGYRLNKLAINLDYTYMTAKGTSSNPQDAYYDALAQRAPRVQMINLNWDQRQTLNTVFSYNDRGWVGSLIGSISSGLPYTPSFARGEVSGSGTFVGLRENSERKPLTYNLDLRVGRNINFGTFRAQVFCNITNLLDTRNALNIYSDTGQADYTLQGINQVDRAGTPDIEISSVDEYFTRPGNFTPPRFIQLGLRISK
jgi:outer membrane receptor for ferrienterochelin and colicin